MVFDTKRDLLNWLRKNNFEALGDGTYAYKGTYRLNHGEYSAPDYKPTRYRDGWGLKACYYYYVGVLGAPEDGRVSPHFFRSF